MDRGARGPAAVHGWTRPGGGRPGVKLRSAEGALALLGLLGFGCTELALPTSTVARLSTAIPRAVAPPVREAARTVPSRVSPLAITTPVGSAPAPTAPTSAASDVAVAPPTVALPTAAQVSARATAAASSNVTTPSPAAPIATVTSPSGATPTIARTPTPRPALTGTATAAPVPVIGSGGTSTRTPTRTATPTGDPASADLYNCSDFPSQAEAQQFLRRYPSDPSRLDQDRNGVACESNPPPRDMTPVPR
ncbi:MAG: hypothetical protein FJ033_02520 [Chloroflexi bacterium]|nr:hypothetical protein [Chloroflexota bacterium]